MATNEENETEITQRFPSGGRGWRVPADLVAQEERVHLLERRVGQEVRRRRDGLGWSQEEVGRRLAVLGFKMSQATVAKLENGVRPIRVNEVAALAEVLGVTMSELLGVATPETPATSALVRFRRLHMAIAEAEAALRAAERREREAVAARETAESQLEELRQLLVDEEGGA